MVGVVWVDFRYVEVEAELWALEQMLGGVEPAIKRLGRAYERSTFAELERLGWAGDPAERSFAWQRTDDVRNFVLPYQLRSGFLVVLWVAYELCLGGIGVELAGKLGIGVSRRGFSPERAGARFKRLGIELEPDSNRLARIQDLYAIRTAIVHASSRRDGMAPEQWNELLVIASRHPVRIDESRGVLMPGPAYSTAAYADVAATLRGLVARAKARVPEGP